MIFRERRISHNIFSLSLDWDIRSLAPDYTRLRKLFIIAIIPNLWNCLERESKKSFLWPPRPKSPIKETIIVLSKRTFFGNIHSLLILSLLAPGQFVKPWPEMPFAQTHRQHNLKCAVNLLCRRVSFLFSPLQFSRFSVHQMRGTLTRFAALMVLKSTVRTCNQIESSSMPIQQWMMLKSELLNFRISLVLWTSSILISDLVALFNEWRMNEWLGTSNNRAGKDAKNRITSDCLG